MPAQPCETFRDAKRARRARDLISSGISVRTLVPHLQRAEDDNYTQYTCRYQGRHRWRHHIMPRENRNTGKQRGWPCESRAPRRDTTGGTVARDEWALFLSVAAANLRQPPNKMDDGQRWNRCRFAHPTGSRLSAHQLVEAT